MVAIRIIATPPGEAPQEVREAWVGIILPLALPGKVRSRNVGVISGPKTPLTYFLWRLTKRGSEGIGYLVESAVAISLLSERHPSAAQWWYQNAPQFLKAGRRFMFAAEVCEEAPDAIWPPKPKKPAP